MYGHDTGNSFVNPHAPGPSDDPTVKWIFERNLGGGTHHPLIVDRTVYTWVDVQDSPERDRLSVEDGSFAVVGIDAETGDTETKFTFTHDLIGRPIIHDGNMYLGSVERVRAYDLHTGERHWESEFAPIVAPSALRLVDDILVVTDHMLTDDGEEVNPQQCAIDATTGEILWEALGDKEQYGISRLPTIADGQVQHPNTKPIRRLSTGKENAVFPPPRTYQVLREGEVYGLNRTDATSRLVSHSWSTLEERWTYVPEKTLNSGWPIVLEDVVVVRGFEGTCVGIDRENGNRRWRTDYSAGHEDGVSARSIERVAGAESVYVVHFGGTVTALDPADGTIEWKLNPGSGWSHVHGCALAGDTLVTVGSGGTLYGIS